MKNQRKLLFVAIIVLLFVGVFLFYNVYYLTEDIIVYESDVWITEKNHGAFNLDSDKLHFGKVAINSPYAYRKMDFTNDVDYPLKFILKMKGEIQDWTTFEIAGLNYDNNFVFFLEPEDAINVLVILNAEGSNLEVDEYYTGEFYVIVKRQTFVDRLFLSLI